jgi:hypothetical protein
MKSYIKIIGPPIFETLKALEKIAVDMPEVCVMSPQIESTIGITQIGIPGYGVLDDATSVNRYFEAEMSDERCNNIISKSGESLGEYDFYYEWFEKPSMENLNQLVKKIDKVMADTGANYMITTK